MERIETELSESRRESIVKIIHSTFSILSVNELEDETIAYGIRNYISKYSLAKNIHLVSKKAYEQMNNKDKILRRHKKKFNVKFEHVVPSKVVLNHLIDLKRNNEYNYTNLRQLLDLTDIVTIITKEENDLLDNKNGEECFRSKMVNNIISEDTIFSRYENVGIDLLKNDNELDGYYKINVYGAIYR